MEHGGRRSAAWPRPSTAASPRCGSTSGTSRRSRSATSSATTIAINTRPAATCAIVRRQSGGGAILHDRELTYSLTLPPGHPLTRDATALYTAVHNAFIAVARAAAADRHSADWQLALNGKRRRSFARAKSRSSASSAARAATCSLSNRDDDSAATNSAPPAYKILGSAQRRHRGAILQHGSLLIAQSPAAPELPGWQELDRRDLCRSTN